MVEALAEQMSRPVDLGTEAARKKIIECDRKLRQYRAALDAGADPAEVSGWINATKQDRADAEAESRRAFAPAPISPEEINDVVEALGGLVEVIVNADSGDKADLYRELGLRLTYRPQKRLVEARDRTRPPHVQAVCVRGGT
jgi:site-specific DNA recombinase